MSTSTMSLQRNSAESPKELETERTDTSSISSRSAASTMALFSILPAMFSSMWSTLLSCSSQRRETSSMELSPMSTRTRSSSLSVLSLWWLLTPRCLAVSSLILTQSRTSLQTWRPSYKKTTKSDSEWLEWMCLQTRSHVQETLTSHFLD